MDKTHPQSLEISLLISSRTPSQKNLGEKYLTKYLSTSAKLDQHIRWAITTGLSTVTESMVDISFSMDTFFFLHTRGRMSCI